MIQLYLRILCTVFFIFTVSAETMYIHHSNGSVSEYNAALIDSITFASDTTDSDTGQTSQYELHSNIVASTFWAGEGASSDNGNISNMPSAWNSNWGEDFGLEDHPLNIDRDADFIPTSWQYTGTQNPYYCALPYNDFGDLDHEDKWGNQTTGVPIDDDWRKVNAYDVIPWADEKSSWSGQESMCKNRWIEVRWQGKTAYCQWEDAGPYYYNDHEYVFGSAEPQNTYDPGAGIDLSPSVWLYLGADLSEWGINDTVDWRFIDAADVPDGPWKRHINTDQVSWE
ncbi:MAG: hypothetical protein ACQEQV_08245 [Fibrobacterota bacterium]